MSASDLMLQRLQDDSDGGPGDRLALLMLEQLFAAPVGSLISGPALAEGFRTALQGWLDSPDAPRTLERSLEATIELLSQQQLTVKQAIPTNIRELLLELAARPYSPDRKLVLTLLDRPPMRELIRGLVTDTVTAFGQRMAAPAATVTKGLGGLARFAADTVKSRGGALGGLVGAVSNEVQNQVEKRGADFADAAIKSVMAEIADMICDPKRAHEAAALRVETLKGAFELNSTQLSRELINLDVPGGAEAIREGVKRWLPSAAAKTTFEKISTAMPPGRTVGELLDGIGQRQAAIELGRAVLRGRLKVLFASPEYAAWMKALEA